MTIEELSVGYPSRHICRGLNYHLPTGASLSVVGYNGSGKTSLLRVLARRKPALEGRVRIDVLPEEGWPGYAEQNAVYLPRMRVGEILTVFESVYPPRSSLQSLRSLLFPCQRTDHARLSQGEKKLLSLYLTLLTGSRLLLLDEPLANLDVHAKSLVCDLLEREAESVIVAHHQPELALKLGGRVLFCTGTEVHSFSLAQGQRYFLYRSIEDPSTEVRPQTPVFRLGRHFYTFGESTCGQGKQILGEFDAVELVEQLLFASKRGEEG